ncbi:amidohydrolase family protein [Roseomonas sp. BN140053]|uniref:amidohydrolase family protein n=1 Tax=Roseomonas sp. BN140053 TaxID=3391898 RepID=UPI0039EC2D12
MASPHTDTPRDPREIGSGRRIDLHHHVVLPEYESALARSGAADPSRPLRKNSDPLRECETIAALGTAGAIVNPLSVAGVHHGDDANARYLTESVNEALARFVSPVPRQLGFFATLPVPDVDGALTQMEHALDQLGADGVVFLSNQNGVYLGDPILEPLYAEMDRRGVVAFVHPASPAYVPTLKLKLWAAYVEYPFETTRVAANLIYNGVMQRYPNIRWVLAHAGGALPYLTTRLKLMEESDKNRPPFIDRVPEGVTPYLNRFHFDTALSGGAAPMAALMAMADPSRVFYGSDWPYVDRHFIGEQLATLERHPGFADGRLAAMEHDNAERLFPRFR